MEIKYNVTGSSRKELVKAVGSILQVEPVYKGAPSFAFEVGGYRIDKNGTLAGQDNPELVADLQGLHGFTAVSEEYDTPMPEAEPVPDDIQIPNEAALGGRVSPYSDFQEPPAYGTPETGVLTIEMPLDGFSEENIANLEKLIASKAALIRKAIGQNLSCSADTLPVIRTEATLLFPWFCFGTAPEEVSAYALFICLLYAAAKEQHRVTAREKPVENEKFTFRVFLIRLGFVGDDYKAARKILLKNLSGNSAFKNGASPKAAEVAGDE